MALVTVHYEAEAIDERTGEPFRWNNRFDEAAARKHLRAIARGTMKDPDGDAMAERPGVDWSGSMKCDKCGTEYSNRHEAAHCRDTLSAQLASMTKRAEEAQSVADKACDNIARMYDDKLGQEISKHDAAEAKLSEMTKRAEAAEARWAKVEECLTKDSWSQINAKAAMYDAAEAKLAMAEQEREHFMMQAGWAINIMNTRDVPEEAREACTETLRLERERLDFYRNGKAAAEAKLAVAVEGLQNIRNRRKESWALAEAAESVLRALGIDPGKEQGK